MYRRDQISRFQRLLTFHPGYSEGRAMYSEVPMGELGYLEDPRHYFGMPAKQMYRAARFVVDIGLHLGKPKTRAPRLHEPWSFDTAVEFTRVHGFRIPAQARDEVLRYLGWPARRSRTSWGRGRSSGFARTPGRVSARASTCGRSPRRFSGTGP